ncbi:MAG: ABC transporter permease [Phycisphaerae bacterium]|nr:ABC transporter permease [Saprospiraceae bacterium]
MNNNLKFTFRTLWRSRLFTFLNIIGLSVGLAAAWVVFQIVDFEFSYDAAHPNRDRAYRVASWHASDGKESGNGGIPLPLVHAASEIPGVELSVPVFDRYYTNVTVPGWGGGNPRVFEEEIRQIVETDGGYFQLTRYDWLAGNPVTALNAPGQVVLTKSRASRYYPGLSPEQIMGQTLYYNDTMQTTVTGVVADLGYPSVFEAKEMRSFSKPISTEKRRWVGVSSNNQLYLLLDPKADVSRVLEQINRVSDENSRELLAKNKTTRRHVLQSLHAVHFDSDFGSHIRAANPKVLYGLMAVGAFLLLLAVINYINLATAQLPQRTREIGVRKTLGGQKGSIIAQFLGETAIVTIAALGLAGLLATWFLNNFQELIPTDKSLLEFISLGSTLGFSAALVVVVSLLSGVYPGWLMARFQPVQLIRGGLTKGSKGGVRLRQGLIVFQFVVSQLLLVVALVVGRQMQFLMRQDLGFDREAIVLIDIPYKILQKPEMEKRHFTLADELKKLPEVASISIGEQIFSDSWNTNSYAAVNEKGVQAEHDVSKRIVDTAALGLYKIPLLAGRNLLPSDTAREVIINETAVETFGLGSPQAAIGQFLKENQGNTYPIVGVVSDFQMLSSHQKIESIALFCENETQSTLSIKMAGSDPKTWEQGFRKMDLEWQKLYPGVPFKYKFYDEVLAEMYAGDRKMSSLANGTMGIALLISCLGLFGMSMFTILRRTKEIGIRKVLGASVAGITGLLAKDFLALVFVAIVIASPIAYYLMQHWLADFAYRIDLQGWMFVAAALAAVIIALLTVAIQSVRAALADPVKSLRSE